MADQIAACAPLSVQAILRAVRETEHLPEEEALKISDEIGWPVFASEDAKEGPAPSRKSAPPPTTASDTASATDDEAATGCRLLGIDGRVGAKSDEELMTEILNSPIIGRP